MTRFDKLLATLVILMVLVLIAGHRPQDAYPGSGRRVPVAPDLAPDLAPWPPAPSDALPAAPPLDQRVRRPPLHDASAVDPVIAITTEPLHSGSYILGTAFSVDPSGLWITARHVASDDCRDLVMLVSGHPVTATIVYLDPQSDLAILRTRRGAPALPLSTGEQDLGESGFSFGYPTGILGATEDTLMGRSRMQLAGRVAGVTPTLTWAEDRRFPETLSTLGGMSGGPMLDASGRVVGSVVAATVRRGRVHTVAPEVLGRREHEQGVGEAPWTPVTEIARATGGLGPVAAALDGDSRIAKIYCKAR